MVFDIIRLIMWNFAQRRAWGCFVFARTKACAVCVCIFYSWLLRRNKQRIVRCKSEIYSLLALLFLLFPKKARLRYHLFGNPDIAMDLADTQHMSLAFVQSLHLWWGGDAHIAPNKESRLNGRWMNPPPFRQWRLSHNAEFSTKARGCVFYFEWASSALLHCCLSEPK